MGENIGFQISFEGIKTNIMELFIWKNFVRGLIYLKQNGFLTYQIRQFQATAFKFFSLGLHRQVDYVLPANESLRNLVGQWF